MVSCVKEKGVGAYVCARVCACVCVSGRGCGVTFWDEKAVVQLMKEELGTGIGESPSPPTCALQSHFWPRVSGKTQPLLRSISSNAPLLMALRTAVSFSVGVSTSAS